MLFHGQMVLVFVAGVVLAGVAGGLFLARGETVPGALLTLFALGMGLGGWLYGRVVVSE